MRQTSTKVINMRFILFLTLAIIGFAKIASADDSFVFGSWKLIEFPICNYALQNGGMVIGSDVRENFTFSIIYYPNTNNYLRVGISDDAMICEKFFPL